MLDDLVTLTEGAARFGVGRDPLRYRILARGVRPVRRAGNARLFRADELAALAREIGPTTRTTPPTGESRTACPAPCRSCYGRAA